MVFVVYRSCTAPVVQVGCIVGIWVGCHPVSELDVLLYEVFYYFPHDPRDLPGGSLRWYEYFWWSIGIFWYSRVAR